MHGWKKLLGLWAVGKTVSSSPPIFMQLLTSVAAILMLGMFSALLLLLLLAGGLGIAYFQLVAHGVAPQDAMTVLALVVVALLGVTVLFLRYYLHQVRNMARKLAMAQAPVTSRISHIADAFLDGLLSSERRSR